MTENTMNREELLNDWSRIQEMFAELAHPDYLAKVATQGAAQEGKGAILLHIDQSKPVIYYKTWKHFEEILDPGEFKQGLFEAINQYDVENQAIIVVSFDDVALNRSLNYQWFGIDMIPMEA